MNKNMDVEKQCKEYTVCQQLNIRYFNTLLASVPFDYHGI